MLNIETLRGMLVRAVVTAVDRVAERSLARAQKDAPVRKVFAGGRQTVRFKTMTEIAGDVALRSKLGLAPEILGDAATIGRLRAAGRNPKAGALFRDPTSPGKVPGMRESGLARTVETRTRMTKGGVPISRTLGNRENRFMSSGIPKQDHRLLGPSGFNLADRQQETALTGRGRYELNSGRATSTDEVGVQRLGGGLRGSIRVENADADDYPVIKASLVAGDKEHDYAKYQELGTSHNPAHPFLRPRLPEWREELPAELRKQLGRLGR